MPKNARDADWSVPTDTYSEGPIEPFKGAVPESDREYFQGVVRFDIDLNENLTLTSLTSYSDFDQHVVTDGDGSALVTFDLENTEGDVQSFNTEIRLSGTNNDNLNWIVGANYEQSDTFERQELRYYENSNYGLNGGINFSGVTLDQDIEAHAVFGNFDYALADFITLKVGARYTETTIEAENCGYSPEAGGVSQLFNFLGGLLGSVPFDPIAPGGCYTLNDNNVPGFPFVDELKEDNTSWRVGLDFNVTDDTLIYFNVSKGYKTGSYPSLAAAGYVALAPVTQESNQSFELGVKSLLADDTLQLNAALFYYDYKNKQVRGKIPDPIFGILDALVNVDESRIQGAEFDVLYQPTDSLTLTASLTYLDSEIKDYEGTNILGFVDDFSGDRLPFTPELTYTIGAEYRVALDKGELFFGANVRGQTDSDAAIAGDRLSFPEATSRSFQKYPFEMDGYALLDLRAGYVSEDEKWKIMVWGKNVTDEYYWTSVIPSSDNLARFAGRPATYGITVGYTY